jgi:hypothetical protein
MTARGHRLDLWAAVTSCSSRSIYLRSLSPVHGRGEKREKEKAIRKQEMKQETKKEKEMRRKREKEMKKREREKAITIPSTKKEESVTRRSGSIDACIIVRTYFGHARVISALLNSLVIEKNQQKDIHMTTRVFLVDTQPPSPNDISSSPHAASFSNLLDCLVLEGNQRAGRHGAVQILRVPFSSNPKTFGYDATDWVLEHLLHNTTTTQENVERQTCSHFIFTNGDNYYVPQLFQELPYNLKNHDFVAWDFVSHHFWRKVRTVRLNHSYIDLGAFIVSADLIRTANATFLPRGVAMDDLDRDRTFAADFYFAKHLTDGLPKERILLRHEVGMVHN